MYQHFSPPYSWASNNKKEADKMSVFFNNSTKLLAKRVQHCTKELYTTTMWDILGMQGWFNIQKLVNVINHIYTIKDKIHMIRSIDAEKAFDQWNTFMITTFNKLGAERNFLNLIKRHLWKPTDSIILNSTHLNVFPLRSGPSLEYPFSPLIFNFVLGVPTDQSNKK